ncbi:MAG TPA: heavy metal translocating P-type ATPase [Gemmatales bacterium]|nr:heavy metal translocating P-type ATPase [Gemmatales bacterium]
MAKMKLAIAGMHCASCVGRVEEALRSVPGVRRVAVSLPLNQALVDNENDEEIDVRACAQAVAQAGFELTTGEVLERTERLGGRLLLAAALATPVAILSMAHVHFPFRDLLFLVLATVVQFGCGWSVLRSAASSARAGAANMDTLIALGTLSAYLASAAVTLSKPLADLGGEVFFEAQMVILTLVLLGRWLEQRAAGAARATLDRLVRLRPATARRRQPDGAEQEMPIEEIQIGDVLIVRPGERLPVDGVVLEGEASVDESLLTGESVPVSKGVGSQVSAGTINTSGLLVVRAAAVGSGTTLARIIALVEEAQLRKAPVQRLADRVAGVFVPAVILLASATFAGWVVYLTWSQHQAWDVSWRSALSATVAVLIIACPCALGLATPMALVVASGRGAELGLLLRGGDVLQKAAAIQIMLIDKTGTLTQGSPTVTAIQWLEEHAPKEQEQLLALVGTLEAGSLHPWARAITAACPRQSEPLADFEERPGRGVNGRVAGRPVAAGQAPFLAELDVAGLADAPKLGEVQPGQTEVWFAIDGRLRGRFVLEDAVRPEAAEAVRRLRWLGVEVWLASGDRPEAVAAAAAAVGIRQHFAGVRPEQKADLVAQAQATGLKVAMLGDGINDAPALARADLGIAMGSGAEVALEAGDMVLLHGDLRDAQRALRLARRTLSIVKQNLIFAFNYNLLALPLAALNVLDPMIASAAMGASSLSVVLNSLRLRRFDP